MSTARRLLLALCALVTVGCALGHSPDLPSSAGDGDSGFNGDGDGDVGVDDSGAGNEASGGEHGHGGEAGSCGDGGMGGELQVSEPNEAGTIDEGCAP